MEFQSDVPSEIQIGEIKPLFPAEFPDTIIHYGLGFQQTRNYIEGYDNFLKRVRKDNPQLATDIPASSGGTLMDLGSALPASLDYTQFETEHTTFGPDAIKKKNTEQRLWVYKLEGGVYVYFLLPLEYESKEYPAKVEEQLKKLDPLLAELRKKRPNMSGAFPKREDAPPAPRRSATPQIQTEREDWKKKHEAWEANRRKWVAGTGVEKPKKFLKEQAKAVEKRAKVDEKLKRTPSKQVEQGYKNVKNIRFWSGLRGRVLGALRFRFGHVFDKVEELFEKIRKKFKHHHQKADALKKTGGRFGGWKKVAADAIIRFGVDILKEMIVYAFKGFVACMNGIVDAIAGKFTSAVDEAKQELVKEIEPVCCEVMDFKKKLEAEYEKHEKSIAQFTETVEEINQWRQIFDDVELAVRIGVQIVSCGAPPGLGCLWGLVAQLGISAGLNLLMRTDYFEEEIAKPAARGLMDAIVGDAFHNFLIEKLEETPLAPYLKEAVACQKRKSVIGGSTKIGNPGKLDPNDPKIAKAREEWEKQYQDEILRDLQTVFQKGKGKKPTKEELEKLVEELKKLKKTPEELRAMFDAARDPASARIDVDKAQAVLAKGEVPKQEEKERKIDYDKAKRSNEKYEKIIGWDPARIAKKPGIKADSKEFADMVYDMQEALKLPKKDGILGPDTVKEYYERNGLKKDFVYESAVKVAEKAKQDKEAAEKGEGGEAEAPSFNLINGPDWVIKDQEKSQNIPKSVRVYISYPDYRQMVKVPKPGDRELVFTPETVTLDIYVHDSLLYRVRNVAVGSLNIYRTVAAIGGASGIWSLELILKNGLEISPIVHPDENLILRRYDWSLDSMEKQAPEQKLP